MPTVSVIIPSYNRMRFLPRAIDSVLTQSMVDFELIVVDDASQDGTADYLLQISDPRVQFIRHIENKGGAASRNTGIQAAHGKYIAFLDSDDEWYPDKLSTQIAGLEQSTSKIGMVYSRARICTSQGSYVPKISGITGDTLEYLLLRPESFLVTPTVVTAKAECIQSVHGFDEALPARQDYDLWLRMAAYGWDFMYVPNIVAEIHWEHNERIGRLPSRDKIRAAELLMTKIEPLVQQYPLPQQHKIFSAQYSSLARILITQGDSESSVTYIRRAIQHDRSNWKLYLLLLLSRLDSRQLAHFKAFKRVLQARITNKADRDENRRTG